MKSKNENLQGVSELACIGGTKLPIVASKIEQIAKRSKQAVQYLDFDTEIFGEEQKCAFGEEISAYLL